MSGFGFCVVDVLSGWQKDLRAVCGPRCFLFLDFMERAKGFEPSTPTLARLCSTPELHPRPCIPQSLIAANYMAQAASRCNNLRICKALGFLAEDRVFKDTARRSELAKAFDRQAALLTDDAIRQAIAEKGAEAVCNILLEGLESNLIVMWASEN